MRNVSLPLLGLLAVSLSFTGCKKDKDDPAPSRTEALTNKNWRLTSSTVDPGIPFGGTTITDLYAQIEDCEKDNLLRFESPNVFKEDEGATRCNTSDPQTVTGTWTLSSDQNRLTTTAGGENTTYDIVEVSANTLKVKNTSDLLGTGINYTVTFTFTKQ